MKLPKNNKNCIFSLFLLIILFFSLIGQIVFANDKVSDNSLPEVNNYQNIAVGGFHNLVIKEDGSVLNLVGAGKTKITITYQLVDANGKITTKTITKTISVNSMFFLITHFLPLFLRSITYLTLFYIT